MPKPDRFAELMAQTQANKASEAKARAAAAARPKPQPGPDRVAPKVLPHQDASSVFGYVQKKIKQVTGIDKIENALDTPVKKPQRNTRGW